MLKYSSRKELVYINILVVEDEALIARKLKNIINKIDSEVNVFITGSAGEALEYAEEQIVDLFCLDIQLEDYNGIELAKKIRNLPNYTLTPIIFITAIPTRELIAYKETHCYDYIIKPFLDEEIYDRISKIINYYKNNQENRLHQDKKIQFKGDSFVYSVFQRDIIYVESLMRRLNIATKNEKYTTNVISLKALAEQLGMDFVQCHKSFFVNKNYIKAFDYKKMEVVLYNQEKIPCGRKYLINLKELGYE